MLHAAAAAAEGKHGWHAPAKVETHKWREHTPSASTGALIEERFVGECLIHFPEGLVHFPESLIEHFEWVSEGELGSPGIRAIVWIDC